MKKLLMVAALMAAVMNVNAQNDELKNEIGITYGFGSASDIVSTWSNAFNFGSSDQEKFWGPVGLEYYHHVTPVIAIGAIGTIAGCSWNNSEGIYKSTKSMYYSLMPSVKFNWLRKTHFGMYSKIGAGMMFQHASREDYKGNKDTDNASNFMFQLAAVGLEFGGVVRGFAELGFGEQGILLAGVRYKF